MDNIHHINSSKELYHNSTFFYMISLDLKGLYNYVNKNYNNKFGEGENLIGRTIFETVHPDDLKVCEEVGIKCMESPGLFFPLNIRKLVSAGGFVKTQWESVLIIENGEPTGIFSIGFDVTDYEFVKGQVNQINKDLEDKSEKLKVIAYEQSHNVRAPLANILGLVNIIKSFSLKPEDKNVVEMLEESSKQLDDIIKGIVNTIYS